VARGIYGIIFENPGVSLEICGLRVDIEEEQGPSCEVAWISRFQIYFPMENLVDRVHGAARVRDGPRWHGQESAVVPCQCMARGC
jgi:hypothetical protein